MDPAISEFLSEGTVHPTTRSHRNAARSYFQFLVQERSSTSMHKIKFTRKQQKELRA